jgi:hypothetical protein
VTESAAAFALSPGTIIGGYRIAREIGGGGMGLVYLAEHMLLGRPAAVKVLRPEVSHVPSAVQRFFTEARATIVIKHPGIVEIFDFGYTASGNAYIVMEWLEGATLSDTLARRRMSLVTTLTVARRMVAALAAAHGAGVVHRDLKPDNVFLLPDPDGGDVPLVKLLDFGIAKLVDEGAASPKQTATGVVMGTPVYMSPEQCRACPCDHRSDLYSLGCVLFEMVAGSPPFGGASAGELLAAHLMQPPPVLAQVTPGAPAALSHLVGRLLAKATAERPADAATVLVELDRIIATLTADRISAQRATVLAPDLMRVARATQPPTGPGTVLAPPPMRRGWRLAVALGLAGAALTVAGVALLRPPTSEYQREPAPAPVLELPAPTAAPAKTLSIPEPAAPPTPPPPTPPPPAPVDMPTPAVAPATTPAAPPPPAPSRSGSRGPRRTAGRAPQPELDVPIVDDVPVVD